MGKIKKFVKEHKKEIGLAVVAGAVTVGCVILHKKANVGYIKPKIKWINEPDKAKRLIEDMSEISKFKDFGFDSQWKISDLGKYGEELIELYEVYTPETVVNGILVMTD